MLQQRTLLWIAVDPERMPAEDEPQSRLGMQRAVDTLGVGFEWPLLVLGHDTDKARRPSARWPERLNHRRADAARTGLCPPAAADPGGLAPHAWVTGLIPLQSERGGARRAHVLWPLERVLREVLQAAALQFLLVGPRRIGKSSLLRRLQAELPKQHASVQVIALDMLGIGEPARLAQLLARRFQRSTIPAGDAQAQAVAIDDMLRTHFS